MSAGCSNCGGPCRGSAKRCAACHVYHWRHGTERPEEVRLRTARRRLERELEGRLIRLATLREGRSADGVMMQDAEHELPACHSTRAVSHSASLGVLSLDPRITSAP